MSDDDVLDFVSQAGRENILVKQHSLDSAQVSVCLWIGIIGSTHVLRTHCGCKLELLAVTDQATSVRDRQLIAASLRQIQAEEILSAPLQNRDLSFINSGSCKKILSWLNFLNGGRFLLLLNSIFLVTLFCDCLN